MAKDSMGYAKFFKGNANGRLFHTCLLVYLIKYLLFTFLLIQTVLSLNSHNLMIGHRGQLGLRALQTSRPKRMMFKCVA